MIELKLTYQLVNKWYHKNNIYVIGYAFHQNILLIEKTLANYFSTIKNEIDFKEKLTSLSGHFAVVIENNNNYLIAVDMVRTFPLFIFYKENKIILSDEITNNNCSWNQQQSEYFKHFYCTLENETLLNEWQQLQASEYAVVNKHDLSFSIKTYFQHSKNEIKKPIAYYINKIRQLEHNLIQNIQKITANKTILIPLSGGYDSRYLLAILKKNNFKHIECFTYGKKESYEVKTAQNVCEKLKVKWHFVEYTDALLNTFFTDDWNNYSNLNHHYSSLPHEQDFFALYYLKQQNLLPENAIILNGFCQDLHAGSIFESQKAKDIKSFIENKNEIKIKDINYENSWNGYQEWFVKNRVSKFIINSVRVYEYFGLDFYLPFWHTDWINFWYEMPFDLRLNQQFYNEYLFNKIFKEYEINYKKPTYDSTNHLFFFKKIIKNILPENFVKKIQTRNAKDQSKDNNNTLYLYHAIYNKLKKKPISLDFRINNIHSLYLLQNLQQD